MTIDHDREWIIGCIKHDGFIKTDRFDKANQIILEALEQKDGDLISREDAIEAIDELTPQGEVTGTEYCIYRSAVNDAEWVIDALPSAEAVSMEEHCKELNDLAVAWKAKFVKAEKRTNEIYDETMAKVAKECKECKERLRNLPSAEAVGWIPCSERLPKWDDMVVGVIITIDNGEVSFADYCSESGTFHDVNQDVWTREVIAWMPLPKPYKGGEDE